MRRDARSFAGGYHVRMLHEEHLPEPLPADPVLWLARWLGEATAARLQPNPNAMVLATVASNGAPSARVVLCKQIEPGPGYVTFFTNYQSRKGHELAANPRAAAVMHWDAMHRQVRLEGLITRSSAQQSDAYFESRAWQSRIGAWASEQSAAVASRAELERAAEAAAQRYGAPSPLTQSSQPLAAGVHIPRPPHWGGYQLWLDTVELWVEGAARLHDRARWQRTLEPSSDSYVGGAWSSTRLQP